MNGKYGFIKTITDEIGDKHYLDMIIPTDFTENPHCFRGVPIDEILATYHELKQYSDLLKKAVNTVNNAAKEAALLMYEPKIKQKAVNGELVDYEDIDEVVKINDDLEIKIKMVESFSPKVLDYAVLKNVLGEADFNNLVTYSKSRRFTFTALKPKI